ncbi:TPA: hypothetical protein DEB00_02570 [Candidatus Uhrbacteria bacterium]|nr:hypothetical protein [Candidatus Uhrbacteria bacterium]
MNIIAPRDLITAGHLYSDKELDELNQSCPGSTQLDRFAEQGWWLLLPAPPTRMSLMDMHHRTPLHFLLSAETQKTSEPAWYEDDKHGQGFPFASQLCVEPGGWMLVGMVPASPGKYEYEQRRLLASLRRRDAGITGAMAPEMVWGLDCLLRMGLSQSALRGLLPVHNFRTFTSFAPRRTAWVKIGLYDGRVVDVRQDYGHLQAHIGLGMIKRLP